MTMWYDYCKPQYDKAVYNTIALLDCYNILNVVYTLKQLLLLLCNTL